MSYGVSLRLFWQELAGIEQTFRIDRLLDCPRKSLLAFGLGSQPFGKTILTDAVFGGDRPAMVDYSIMNDTVDGVRIRRAMGVLKRVMRP
jgi:hypothetical protein